MRLNTQKIFETLNRGAFIAEDSTDLDTRHLYADIEENHTDYEAYFAELGLRLESGNGYYYFAREKETRLNIESKLESFARWIDILDFLKTYSLEFSAGFLFRAAGILERINIDVELRDKARKLFRKLNTNSEITEKLIGELTSMGYAELVNEQDGTYKVTAAFRYVEDLVEIITIYNEEDTLES